MMLLSPFFSHKLYGFYCAIWNIMVAFGAQICFTAELTLNVNSTTATALIPYHTKKKISSEKMVT